MTRDRDRRQGNLAYNGENQREQVNITMLSSLLGSKWTPMTGAFGAICFALVAFADGRYTTLEKHTALEVQVSEVATTVHTLVGRLHRDRKQEVRHRIRVSDGWINRLKLIPESDRTIYDKQALLAEQSIREELDGILKELINESFD